MANSDLQTGKLTAMFPIRVPEITKAKLDKLNVSFKRKLNEEILITMARILHESEFDPSVYLKDE
jgi:hypothetical protein